MLPTEPCGTLKDYDRYTYQLRALWHFERLRLTCLSTESLVVLWQIKINIPILQSPVAL